MGALQRDFLLATRDVGVFGNPRKFFAIFSGERTKSTHPAATALVLRQRFKEEINGSMRPGGHRHG